MCGIVYYHNTKGKPVAKKVYKRYKRQRVRGTEGFGVYRPATNQLAFNTKERHAMKHLRSLPDSVVLFHHRNPTSTKNVHNACHPFSTKSFFGRNYVLVHNGVVSNSRDLKPIHEKEYGIKYISEQPDGRFNDSEALLWEVALYLEGKKKTVDAIGSIAFICYVSTITKSGKTSKPKLYYYHNCIASPLVMQKHKNTFSLASLGEGTMVPYDKLFCYDYKTEKVTDSPLTLPTSWQSYNNYGASKPYSDNRKGGATPPVHAPHKKGQQTGQQTGSQRGSYLQEVKPKLPARSIVSQEGGSGSASGSAHFDDSHGTSLSFVDPNKRIGFKVIENILTKRIKDKYEYYMIDAAGEYSLAITRAMEDLELAYEQDCMEDVELLESVIDLLSNDGDFEDVDSINIQYATEARDIQKEIAKKISDVLGEDEDKEGEDGEGAVIQGA